MTLQITLNSFQPKIEENVNNFQVENVASF